MRFSVTWRMRLQRLLGRLTVLPLSLLIIGLLRWKCRYHIQDLARIRAEFSRASRRGVPLIVCANHLTLIDSVILLWAVASPLRYVTKYRLFSWNLPALENVKRHPSWTILTYLNKCILVDRFASHEKSDEFIDTVTSLIRSGDIVTIFPEGTRSRCGRIEPELVTYGVGKILQRVPEANVLCIYCRGQGQESYSDFPRRGEVFDIEMRVIHPTTTHTGLKGIRSLSMQVIDTLREMENTYFSKPAHSRGQVWNHRESA